MQSSSSSFKDPSAFIRYQLRFYWPAWVSLKQFFRLLCVNFFGQRAVHISFWFIDGASLYWSQSLTLNSIQSFANFTLFLCPLLFFPKIISASLAGRIFFPLIVLANFLPIKDYFSFLRCNLTVPLTFKCLPIIFLSKSEFLIFRSKEGHSFNFSRVVFLSKFEPLNLFFAWA